MRDVIRIARIAEFSKTTPEMALELALVSFTLIANAYGHVWAMATNQLRTLWELMDLLRRFLGMLGDYLIYYGVDILEEFVKWILSNFNLVRPTKK